MTSEVKPIQEGFHTITASLVVNDAVKAIEFYKTALGAQELLRSPAPDGRIMHAELKVGDSIFFLNDEFPDFASPEQAEFCTASPVKLGGRTGSIILSVENADNWFDRAVAAGAKVVMPMADAFWGDRFGMVVDPFGHAWAFSTHVRDVTPEELEQAAAQLFSQPDGKAAGSQ
ncbi:MAG TPA: VOC family protein [Blastocatellia bacterium]|nr:VOC family protein [Blastocatellia bacterium]